MKLLLTEKSWILDDLNPIEWRFLSQLPDLAAGKELPEKFLRRLKPNPLGESGARDLKDFEFIDDWSEFVEPDLDQFFVDARTRVANDLEAAASGGIPDPEALGDGLPTRIEIPNEHSEQWYNAINQARLLMNEAHQLAEASERFEFQNFDESEEGAQRFILMAQYEFYTALQSILIEHRMEP
jgi:hypothetical protein